MKGRLIKIINFLSLILEIDPELNVSAIVNISDN
jgi:hypothetical protein